MIYDPREFGAKGDGAAKDTAAVQAAVDAAAAAGGGEVRLSAGTYLCGTVYLKDGVDFHLEAGAVVKASPDKEDYNAADVCPQNSRGFAPESVTGQHLFLAVECKRVTMRGPGKIDGNSAAFLIDPATGRSWGFKEGDPFWKGQGMIPFRPAQMLCFLECSDVRIADLELADSSYWNLFLHGCERVSVSGLDIHNEKKRFHTHNGDGIDIDCSRDVAVSGCRIDTADDCITLRASGLERLKHPGDCARVTVENCTLSTPCNALRVGVGNGRIRDCSLSGITVRESRTAVNFISAWNAKQTDGVDISGIRLSDWDVDCEQLLCIYGGAFAEGVKRTAATHDVVIENVSGRAPAASRIEGCSADCPARNIALRDIDCDCEVQLHNAVDVKAERCKLRLAESDSSESRFY